MARTDQPHKATFEIFVERVTDFTNPLNEKHRNLDYGRPETRAAWNGSKSKIPIWCTTHQKFFIQQAANHRDLGQGCPECGFALRTRKKTKKDPIADFVAKHGDTYDYSRVRYINNHTPVEIVCRIHGPFSQKPIRHVFGDGCPECWEERRKQFGADRTAAYLDEFVSRARKAHGDLYEIVKFPTHAHDKVTLMCAKHGEFEQKAFSHLAGHGCYRCGNYSNKTQKEVAAFVESLGVKVDPDNRTILKGPHIDIWVPERNIGIEYHGSYWHTESRVGSKHRKKWEAAEAAGVRLIQLFDFEWLGRNEAVKNRLKAIFGVTGTVAARKCDLREVPHKEAQAFFERVHTQGGRARSLVAYALFSEDRMVACASFGQARGSGTGWELLRYASDGRVQGGFQRLFKAFNDRYAPATVLSYCDLRWGNGQMYEAAGFRLDGITRPDYWYTTGADKVPREKAQGRPEGQTEKEWALANGYEKVLGVGHQRWIWTPVNDLI